MTPARERNVCPARRFGGRLRVPGDKSVSHRALILGALAVGRTRISGLAPGGDCRSTRSCLASLGVRIEESRQPGGPVWTVEGVGLGGLRAPAAALDAGNSGTTARFLMGVLAGHAFTSTLIGDASLSRRPMRRVADPLLRMGARIEMVDGHLPVVVAGGALRGITLEMTVPSAQVKSAVLLAGLHADGVTTVVEADKTRDHTERALERFGAGVSIDGRRIAVAGGGALRAADITVPGDPSSAAFWAAAAAAIPGADVTVEGMGLNPTRTAFLGVLERMGARIEVVPDPASGPEPVGTVTVRHGSSRFVDIHPSEVAGLIDELPALAGAAAHGGGLSVTGAAELRVKESDRITALADGLRALGAEVEEFPDGFRIPGARRLTGGTADAVGDHRLAMAFAIAALGASGESRILGSDAVDVSYPGFFEALKELCR